MAKLDGPALTAFMRAQIGDVQPFDVSAKKETVGKLKTIHYRIKLKNTGTEKEEAVTQSSLGARVDVYGAVAAMPARVRPPHHRRPSRPQKTFHYASFLSVPVFFKCIR